MLFIIIYALILIGFGILGYIRTNKKDEEYLVKLLKARDEAIKNSPYR